MSEGKINKISLAADEKLNTLSAGRKLTKHKMLETLIEEECKRIDAKAFLPQ